MALPPDDPNRRAEEEARRQKVQDEMLMREVDDAVRQDQFVDVWQRYGKVTIAAVVIGLAALGGYLWWDSQQEAGLDSRSDELITAIDQLEAGNVDSADASLAGIAEDGSPGARAAAQMLQAGIDAEAGRTDEAIAGFDKVSADSGMPQVYRDLASIRSVALQYDDVEPAVVIDRLKPIAVPGNAWFGSAGELVGMAYLDQGNEDLAGPLFAQIAKDESLPQSLRSRSRQLAGLLGYDAVVDVDQLLDQIQDSGAPAPAAPQ